VLSSPSGGSEQPPLGAGAPKQQRKNCEAFVSHVWAVGRLTTPCQVVFDRSTHQHLSLTALHASFTALPRPNLACGGAYKVVVLGPGVHFHTAMLPWVIFSPCVNHVYEKHMFWLQSMANQSAKQKTNTAIVSRGAERPNGAKKMDKKYCL